MKRQSGYRPLFAVLPPLLEQGQTCPREGRKMVANPLLFGDSFDRPARSEVF